MGYPRGVSKDNSKARMKAVKMVKAKAAMWVASTDPEMAVLRVAKLVEMKDEKTVA